jgi:chromosome segregation ATPase
MAKRTVKKMNNEDKVLKGIENIVILMREQYGSLDGKYSSLDEKYSSLDEKYSSLDEKYSSLDEKYSSLDGKYNSLREEIKAQFENNDVRFNRLENAVMETNLNVKTIAFRLEKTEQKIDLAVTNHESRIRRLEEKSGV